MAMNQPKLPMPKQHTEERNTVNLIEVMLHCYTTPGKHPRIQAIAVQKALTELVKAGLIVETDEELVFDATEKGKVYVEMLCTTPFPIEKTIFADPRTK